MRVRVLVEDLQDQLLLGQLLGVRRLVGEAGLELPDGVEARVDDLGLGALVRVKVDSDERCGTRYTAERRGFVAWPWH